MQISGFIGLACFAGAIHMVSPDHWVPFSVMSWQRGWRFPRLFGASLLLSLAHVGLAFLIYLALQFFLNPIPASSLVIFAGVLVATLALVRTLRFDRIGEVFGGGGRKKSVYGLSTVLSLLGPSEVLLPILMKARMIGVARETVLAGFTLGTLSAILFLALASHLAWNQPSRLPRLLSLTRSRFALAPMSVGIALAVLYGFVVFPH
jgi:hypothetical protein